MTTSPAPRPVVRLFADHSSPYPLWAGTGKGEALDPTDLGVSPDLAVALRAWVAHWSVHQDELSGWHPPEARATHQVQGHQLFLSLVEQLGDRYDVVRPSLGH